MQATRRELLGLTAVLLAVWAGQTWWEIRANKALGPQVAASAKPGDIRMISSETCGICTAARHWFTEHKVAFSECLVERDPACRAEFNASGAPGTPLMKVRGQAQLGFSPQRLLEALQSPKAAAGFRPPAAPA